MNARTKVEKGSHYHRSTSPRLVGIIVIIGVALAFLVAYEKQRIASVLSSGDTITAEFSRNYKLDPYTSLVKLAGVNVGEVTGIDDAPDGGALVSMRIDHGVKDQLGGDPMAEVKPTLVVGGVYFIQLTPGGRGGVFNNHIPVSRTTIPVELDQVLDPINTSAQKGLRGFTQHFNDTMIQGGSAATRQFLEQTPASLRPTGAVLAAFRGTQPDQDLPRLVSGLEGFSAVFNRKDGQFANIIDSLDTTTAALNAESQPIASTLGTLPQTLRTTRVGLADLQGTLDRLTVTAPRFRDSAQELNPLLEHLAPVISRARPVVRDLRDVLYDARPLLRRAISTVHKGNGVLGDIRGPVLDRINGPIKHTVLTPFHGSGVYAGGGNDNKMYQEIAYLMSAFDQVWQYHDQNGALGRLSVNESGDAPFGGSGFPRTVQEQLQDKFGTRPLGPSDCTKAQCNPGLSKFGNKNPINPGMKPIPTPGPLQFPAGGNTPQGANPLLPDGASVLSPTQGGSK